MKKLSFSSKIYFSSSVYSVLSVKQNAALGNNRACTWFLITRVSLSLLHSQDSNNLFGNNESKDQSPTTRNTPCICVKGNSINRTLPLTPWMQGTSKSWSPKPRMTSLHIQLSQNVCAGREMGSKNL